MVVSVRMQTEESRPAVTESWPCCKTVFLFPNVLVAVFGFHKCNKERLGRNDDGYKKTQQEMRQED